MKVAAIILNYFGADKTHNCLKSLLNQGLTTILIIDNSANISAFQELQQKTQLFDNYKDFEIILIENNENVGFGKGMNQGLNYFEIHNPHDFYLLINNDAQATPNMLKHLLNHFENSPKTIMISPQVSSFNQIIPFFYYHSSTGLLLKNKIKGSFLYLSGCCLLLRKEIIKVPFFDEDFFMYGEDTELSWRLQQQGYIIENVINATVIHDGVGSSSKGGEFYEYHMAVAHLLLAKKLSKNTFNYFVFLTLRMITLTIRASLRSLRYQTLIPFKMLAKAWLYCK